MKVTVNVIIYFEMFSLRCNLLNTCIMYVKINYYMILQNFPIKMECNFFEMVQWILHINIECVEPTLN